MPRSFLQRLLERKKRESDVQTLLSTKGTEAADGDQPNSVGPSDPQNSTPATEGRSLFAFVDLKDPFVVGEIAGEALPGPILSIMSAKKFDSLFLFHTPHTRENATATCNEITGRYPRCRVEMHELPVSDPKDYSLLMGTLCRRLRDFALSPTSNVGDLARRLPCSAWASADPLVKRSLI